jgi:hypothetical protein
MIETGEGSWLLAMQRQRIDLVQGDFNAIPPGAINALLSLAG